MGNSSVKGLRMMELIYPSDDGSSVFDGQPKLKAKLHREYAKGTIKLAPSDEEEPVDGDMNLLVDRSLDEVWNTYDPKGTGMLDKKALEKFFKDALLVYSLRHGGKTEKDIIPKGVKESEAMKQSIALVAKSGSGRATRQEFDLFVHTYDNEEALYHFLGKTGGIIIDLSKAQKIDVSQFQGEGAGSSLKPVYRDYPDD